MSIRVEPQGRAIYLWNPETLAWEPATTGPGTGDVVSVDNWPATLTGSQVPIQSDNPLNQYRISDIDTSGATQYFGYTNKDGEWYIMQLTDTDVRYARGLSNYVSNWLNRANLTYDYFFNVF